MSIFKVDEKTFEEIHTLLADGGAVSQILYDLGLQRPALNIVKKYQDYSEYELHFEDGKRDELPETPTSKLPKVLQPKQKGYLRGTLSEGKNDPYSEMKDALALNIKGMWKVLGLLENRKSELERQIRGMEGYIQQGLKVAEEYIEE